MTDDLGVVDEQAAGRASADNEAKRTDARVLCPPDFFICVKCLSPSVPAKPVCCHPGCFQPYGLQCACSAQIADEYLSQQLLIAGLTPRLPFVTGNRQICDGNPGRAFFLIQRLICRIEAPSGGMAERFKALVLKTSVGESSPWVRIPLPPPYRIEIVE